jgi:twitching motility two-component system response regulator PilG
MLTAKSGLIDKVKGKISGCSEYLTKPFTPEELMARVKKYLK